MEVKRRTARQLVKKLSSISDESRTEALSELRLLSKHDPEIRPHMADCGAVPLLADLLHSSNPSTQENAVATLLNISITTRDPLMSTRGLLDSLSHLLRHALSPASSQTAAATLFSLLSVDAYRPIIGAKIDIISSLLDLLHPYNSPTRSVKDALKALFGIALYPMNRARMVDLGAVPALFGLVVNDGRVGIVEDTTAVIAQIAGCYESADAFRRVSGARVLLDLMDSGTGSTVRVRENAASALLNLARSGGEEVVEEIRGMGSALDGISELAEFGSARAKSKVGALLEILAGPGSGVRDLRFGYVNSYP